MKKIACIGDKDSVLCFMAIGCSVFIAESPEEAARTLRNLAADESYPIIFLMEKYYKERATLYRDKVNALELFTRSVYGLVQL